MIIRKIQLILSLLLTISLTTAYAGYSDMPQDWAQESMCWAIENKIIDGDNGKINPDGYITRAELSAVLSRCAAELLSEREYTETQAVYNDVSPGDWFYDYVCIMSRCGIMTGDNGTYRPQDQVTREEAVVSVGRLLELGQNDAGCSIFSDSADISEWAKGCVGAAADSQLINGDGGAFDPKGNITRKEFIAILYRCRDLLSPDKKSLDVIIDNDGAVWSPIY